MNKVAIIYWSGTGHTQAMAEAAQKGCEGTLLTAAEFDAKQVGDYDAFAFGCPSMGSEQLEESEFQPMWDAVKGSLAGKPVALFGSYGWGDGEWMRTWEDECRELGVLPVCESVICNDEPTSDVLEDCERLGAALK